MDKIINNNKINLLTVFIMTVILFSIIHFGYVSGVTQTQAEFITQNSKSIQQGLEYFYNDQGRFPTQVEFLSQQIMGSYFSSWPAQSVGTVVCPVNYQYRQLSASSYELKFCLPTTYENLNNGWNSLSVNKIEKN